MCSVHSVQTGMWDPQPPSKHASPLPEPPASKSRLRSVTRATPAKRITFYKSGDSQFGGVRMAIHKRSFKCFDALLDDLSQKVPLPFGVRTITTPRGTNTIRHLEQLQDGGCYLCSDQRQTKPINMELANKHPNIWCCHTRRPQPPEPTSTRPARHLTHQQRRVLLVKNSEPGVRRSVMLSRRSTRSLRAFLDEVSEVMQFHVRKLYTAEGHKIDSVQSLLTCPGVLVCVGREAFSPMLINFIKKNSEEKLPGLGSRSPGLGPRTPGNGVRSPATQGARSPPHGAQSRASEYSDGRESKKSVNFGLETKKSIIHPRSDSSNRSTRFSLSSDKSYAHAVSARPAIINDDIEKRVLVNKDGSLSVEMRVRFRLHSDETLQWSTRIKKSPSLISDCWPPGQVQPHCLQKGPSESCSDPDSLSFQPEGAGSNHRTLETNRCSCCYQQHERQYDLWENPAHCNRRPRRPHTSSRTHTVTRHTNSSSSSSSCHSRAEQRSSCGGGSVTERSQLIQETCVTEQVESRVEVEQDGDTRVEVCRVSRCCSRSEVVSRDSDLRPLSRKSVEDEPVMEEEEERRLSSLSSSSHVLQSLKEDQDDEDDDPPPSPSQCCHSNKPSPSPTSHTHTQGDEEKRTTSRTSARSFTSNKSSKSEKPVTPLSSKPEEKAQDNDNEMVEEETQQSGEGTVSALSACVKSCRSETYGDTGDGEKNEAASVLSCKSASYVTCQHKETDLEDMVDRAHTAMSGTSHASRSSGTAASPHREDKHDDSQSVVSVKSPSSLRSSVSHKSSSRKNEKSVSRRPDAGTVNTAERETASDDSNGTADKTVTETTPADETIVVKSSEHALGQKLSPKRTRSTRTRSPKSPQCLRPGPCGGETRASSVLSVRSTTSAKSVRSKCGCGADSTSGKRRKEKIVMNKEDDEEVKSEEAAGVLSSSSRGQRSRCSSGSVSLVLPEDGETAESDSGKSNLSFHTNTEGKGRVTTANPDETSAVKDDVEGTGSKVNENQSTVSYHPPSAALPTIETPGDKREESGGQKTERGASAFSTKSSSSHKCSCGVRASAHTPESQQHGRTPTSSSSSLSLASAKVQNNPPASIESPVANSDCENQKRPDETAGVHTTSPCCIRPESAASAKSGSKVKKTGGGSFKPDEDEREAGSDDGGGGEVELSSSEKRETLIKSSEPRPSHCRRSHSRAEARSGSSLSHSLSAANLLKETTGTRPHSQQSESKTESEKSARYQRRRKPRDQKEKQEITPACLPNASPNEVVSNWLRSIPADGGVLALGDEEEEGQPGKEVVETSRDNTAKEENGPEADTVDKEETPEPDEDGEGEGEAKCDVEEEEQSPDPGAVRGILLSSDDSLPKNCQSAVAVMKVLLNSSTGRSRSLPEVSPVYGRRLSTSARELLDCLAQLQLIRPAVSPGYDQHKDHNQQREDIMVILQSLWQPEPRDFEAQQVKDVGAEQMTPPRSSSGVDMSSGSAGSGKENGNQHGAETPPKEMESLHGYEGAEKVVRETGDMETETKPEGAAREQTTEGTAEEEQSPAATSLESLKATENPSSSDKSSPNHASKSATDNEQETVDDSSSGTPPTLLRGPLSKITSQDPDPLWVLHLLKKMEKQFISHYVTAMTEFKVRWDLDDSLILNTMISELRDEVSRRIQGSVEREMRKIQGRAGGGGRSPRPPQGANLSRESTMTEKRRRMLKVMKNQSVKTADSLSDGEMTGEFSDQRSDDEYCPCDACVRKKMAARPLKTNPAAAQAPVMMEFDLVKILQQKKTPKQATVAQSVAVESDRQVLEEEVRNLEVVQEEEEEEEETKEDIKAKVVLEEVIPEEEEVEEEIGQTGVVEKEDKEASVCGAREEEEKKEAECQSEEGCDKSEEEEEAEDKNNNMGEDETPGDEVDEEETVEDEESEKGGNEEAKECEGSDSKPEEEEEEERTGRESEGEQETDNNNRSAVVVEGNINSTAEDEEDGNNDPREGGSQDERQGGEACEQEKASSQELGVTEGEGAGDEESPNGSSPDEAGGEEEEAVAEADEEEVSSSVKEDSALLHQLTRTSVESQPGSLEDISTDSPQVHISTTDELTVASVSAAAGGGGGNQKRSPSPARVRGCKPKESDDELGNI